MQHLSSYMKRFQINGLIQVYIISILIESTAIYGQRTPINLGCTFTDHEHVYNVELVPGQHTLPCPDAEALKGRLKGGLLRAEKTYNSSLQLTKLLNRLETSNQNLEYKLHRLREELHETKIQLKREEKVNTECPPIYQLRSDTYKSCYLFAERYLNWFDAETYCKSTGAHLVALETSEEQEFLINYVYSTHHLPGSHLWTGGNDIANEDMWMWAGVNVGFNYSRWLLYPHTEHGLIQMPDNHLDIEHCVHMFHLHGYGWNDLQCTNKHYFVCEFKLI